MYPQTLRRALLVASVTAFAAVLPLSAQALDPERVFAKASPGVFLVVAKKHGRPTAGGSGVVVGDQLLVTNCHVLPTGATEFEVKRGTQRWVAYRSSASPADDLCLLRVPGLNAPAAKFAEPGDPIVGARAYSIGAPAGLELTIAEGLVSGIRSNGSVTVIQTSAPISQGSSGGGLFDADGRLIGITTFYLQGGQNVNFVVPASQVQALLTIHTTIAGAINALLVSSSPGNTKAPERAFSNPTDRAQFVRWLEIQSERLKPRMPDYEARIHFLKVLDYEAGRAGIDRQLALALVDVLSGFRKNYVLGDRRGYLGVSGTWFQGFADDSRALFTTQVNLRSGLVRLRQLLDASRGDLYVALNSYADQSASDAKFPNRVLSVWKSKWANEASN